MARNRPRFATTVDPTVAAYLGQPEINAGRVIDLAVKEWAGNQALEKAARKADLTPEDTDFADLDL